MFMAFQLENASNQEFVNFCFRTILGREPDEKGEAVYVDALNAKALTREKVLIQFLLSEEFKTKTKNTEFFPPGHYYSAIPSLEDREAFLAQPLPEQEFLGINLNTERQFELLTRFRKYYDECPFRDTKSGDLRYYYVNPSYSYTDALTLYSMLREFKPRRIIEIGSGYSSCVMLDTAEFFLDSSINFTFIEPYPELLHSLIKENDKKHTFIPARLQDVNRDVFKSLDANDILFVDSTHVSKLGSDVNRIIFEILPILRRGVLIHFHDIFWPFEYPSDWIRKGIAWNEAYILRAFLEFNKNFEIVFFASFLHQHQHDWFQENMPLCLKNKGGNIWIKRKKE
jgi:predicted O-methyltransferase YrrM